MSETTAYRAGNGGGLPKWAVTALLAVIGPLALGVSSWAAKGYMELREKSAAQDVRNEAADRRVDDIKTDLRDIKRDVRQLLDRKP